MRGNKQTQYEDFCKVVSCMLRHSRLQKLILLLSHTLSPNCHTHSLLIHSLHTHTHKEWPGGGPFFSQRDVLLELYKAGWTKPQKLASFSFGAWSLRERSTSVGIYVLMGFSSCVLVVEVTLAQTIFSVTELCLLSVGWHDVVAPLYWSDIVVSSPMDL